MALAYALTKENAQEIGESTYSGSTRERLTDNPAGHGNCRRTLIPDIPIPECPLIMDVADRYTGLGTDSEDISVALHVRYNNNNGAVTLPSILAASSYSSSSKPST
jgi:hypothetical protein